MITGILFFFTARIRRMGEGNVFSLFTSGGGGVPVSHNALQHFPECHGAARGGGGKMPGPAGGGTLPGPAGGGVPWPGGVPCLGGTLPGGVPCPGGYPVGGYPVRGGTQLGQHREYLLHGGRYASCVHAGGLSCLKKNFEGHESFSWGHWYPCFGLLVTSALCFFASSDPQIHLWCDTCWHNLWHNLWEFMGSLPAGFCPRINGCPLYTTGMTRHVLWEVSLNRRVVVCTWQVLLSREFSVNNVF